VRPMRRHEHILIGAALAALLTAPSFASTDTNIYGIWATQKNNGRVEVVPCDGAVCARILDGNQIRANPDQQDVRNPDPAKRTRPVKGMYILEGYRGGPSQWQGGTVYDPQTGDQSNDSTLTLVSPTTLKVEGCRLFFCRSETWSKVSDTQHASSGRSE
jgi:uncharacterized protein (DUF2147 family)